MYKRGPWQQLNVKACYDLNFCWVKIYRIQTVVPIFKTKREKRVIDISENLKTVVPGSSIRYSQNESKGVHWTKSSRLS